MFKRIALAVCLCLFATQVFAQCGVSRVRSRNTLRAGAGGCSVPQVIEQVQPQLPQNVIPAPSAQAPSGGFFDPPAGANPMPDVQPEPEKPAPSDSSKFKLDDRAALAFCTPKTVPVYYTQPIAIAATSRRVLNSNRAVAVFR